jgi:hypothetical protein
MMNVAGVEDAATPLYLFAKAVKHGLPIHLRCKT